MNANIGFALSAAVLSLAIVIGAALKGDWAVAVVYALLVGGFFARAAYGRAARRRAASDGAEAGGAEDAPAGPPRTVGDGSGDGRESAPPGPRHEPERELRRARFRRR